MLRLLESPTWQGNGDKPRLLPCTLPSALAIHLAAQPGWVDRERVACLFWPERPPTEALHNLRVNLHRLRGQLADWGQAECLRSERQRLTLGVPTDLARLHEALLTADARALAEMAPWRLLEGFRIPGFEAFQSWVDDERRRLTRQWALAAERALGAALAAGAWDAANALFEPWRAQDAATPESLVRLRPAAAGETGAALWRQWQAQLGVDGDKAHAAQPRLAIVAGAAAPPLPLGGRAAEQVALRALRGPATLVTGEPGIGKTVLVASTHPGRPLLRGREGLESVPFGPLAELLRREPGWLADPGAYRLDLARLLPEIAPDEPLPPLDAHTAKLRLLEGLARVVETRTDLLLVDDLQWCDGALLEWLVFVAHRGRLRWVATQRTQALPAPVRQAVQALRSASLLDELALGALDLAALTTLCRQRQPQSAWPDDRVAELLQRSGGNPFFALELMEAGRTDVTVPRRSHELVQARVRALPAAAQAVLEAAAVLAQPAALPLLAAVAGSDSLGLARPPEGARSPLGGEAHSTSGAGGPARPAEGVQPPLGGQARGARGGMVSDDALATCVSGCEQALAAGLLVESTGGLECRHDLVRSAVQAALSAPRRQWLHRRAALALGPAAPPLALAQHWEAAGEPQTALAWRHRGALQHKDFGRLDEARALWGRIAAEASDPALALRARLAQAECDLFENLDAGRDALEAVLAQVAAIADPAVRDELEAQALAGLVDNRVFSGDHPRARQLAAQLRPLLPRLPSEERVHAIEVLIELAMREPDIDDALALLAEARRLAPKRPSLASFEGQIHWFGGQPLAARAAFERLLATHPEFCSGLTIENDLAVMCHATGDLRTAEAMARRSLASWKGVAHTETLSLLVLGSTLTGAGRLAEAAEALDRAEALAQRQGSQLFSSEVHARRARLLSACGRHEDALAQAARAAPLVRDDDNPLRLSQLLAAQVAAAAAAGQPIDPMLRTRLQAACGRSLHPLVHARLARVEVDLALAAGDGPAAGAAGERMLRIARGAGLLELQAEAWLLQVRAALLQSDGSLPGTEQLADVEQLADTEHLAREAATLSDSQGYLDLSWRGWSVLARLTRDPALAERAQAALAQLVAGAPSGGFDAAAAALREPRP
jgi:hypothetical protein